MHHSIRIPLAVCVVALLALTACGRRDDRGIGSPAPGGLRVTDVTLGRAIGGDRAITDRTETFRPNDTIYASVATDGTAENVALRARWTYEDGQVVDESTRTLSFRGQERTEFHISKPDGWPAGDYRFELFLGDRPAEVRDFRVRD